MCVYISLFGSANFHTPHPNLFQNIEKGENDQFFSSNHGSVHELILLICEFTLARVMRNAVF